MSTAYDTFVSPTRWRLVLSSLALTLIGGAALALILALGAADPPRAPHLALNLRSGDGLVRFGTFGDAQLFAFPIRLFPPFTVEVEASSSGAADSAWGIWMRVTDHYGNPSDLPMLIDQNGYVVSALDSPALQHHLFIHVQYGDNRLYLHFDKTKTAVLRINDEIFATVPLPVTEVEAAGLALIGDPALDWKSIKIYTNG